MRPWYLHLSPSNKYGDGGRGGCGLVMEVEVRVEVVVEVVEVVEVMILLVVVMDRVQYIYIACLAEELCPLCYCDKSDKCKT